MIRISDAAQAHFAKLLANQEEGTQIRVFVINPGTPNAECGVSYCPPDAVEATDTALKFDLLTAYVDELSAPYLEDAEIDFVTDQLGLLFRFKFVHDEVTPSILFDVELVPGVILEPSIWTLVPVTLYWYPVL